MPAVVCDSSPLIYLSRLEHFDLLRVLYDAVLAPPAVWQEVAIDGAGLPEAANLKAAVAEGWIRIEAASSAQVRLLDELGRGEAEAIALACERRALLVCDDRLARTAAESLGLVVAGTVGLLVRARRMGHISSVAAMLDRLSAETNFRISDALVHKVLEIAGERA